MYKYIFNIRSLTSPLVATLQLLFNWNSVSLKPRLTNSAKSWDFHWTASFLWRTTKQTAAWMKSWMHSNCVHETDDQLWGRLSQQPTNYSGISSMIMTWKKRMWIVIYVDFYPCVIHIHYIMWFFVTVSFWGVLFVFWRLVLFSVLLAEVHWEAGWSLLSLESLTFCWADFMYIYHM